MARPDPGKFEFVISEPNEKLSRETHSKIRRHATRAVLEARRRAGGARAKPQQVLRALPLSGLELLARDCGLNPLDLSALTSIHLGPIAAASLHAQPGQLQRLLSCQQVSYFSFIPARFSEVVVLEDAYRCLLTAAHSMLVPNKKTSDKTILGYYGRSLRSLQVAVDDPISRHTAETLCAVAILALFEILNSPGGDLWGQHMRGASRLIQSRGPESFTSDFDMSLLVLLGPPMCAECLSNCRESFLDDPAWREVLCNAIRHDGQAFSERSPLSIGALMIMCQVPGLAKRTDYAVTAHSLGQTVNFDEIVKGLYSVRAQIMAWRRDFNTTLMRAVASKPIERADRRYEVLGMSLVFHIICVRMLACIAPRERRFLEDEVQNVALELQQLRGSLDVPDSANSRAGFFLSQKASVAALAIQTHDIITQIGDDKIIDLASFKQWWMHGP